MLVAQLCPTLCDPKDYSPPVSSVHKFSRQEYWSGLPFPSPGDLPDPGIEPTSPYCRQILYHLIHQGSPMFDILLLIYNRSKIKCNNPLFSLDAVITMYCCKSENFKKQIIIMFHSFPESEFQERFT